MQNYIGDMLTRIRNGQRARLGAVYLHKYTPKICIQILILLRNEGYITGFQYILDNNTKQLKVLLKYNATGEAVVKGIFQVSTPGKGVYLSVNSLWKPKNNFGIFILSTTKGLMVDREARLNNLGGEILCGVY